jgi:hypothetical protein
LVVFRQGRKVLQGHRVLRAQPALQGHKGLREFRGQSDLRVLRATPDHRGHRDQLDLRALKAIRDRKVLRGLPVVLRHLCMTLTTAESRSVWEAPCRSVKRQ